MNAVIPLVRKHRGRFVPALLALTGVGALAAALAADLLSAAAADGFGIKQTLLLLAGFWLVLHAVSLTTAAGWEQLDGLLRRPGAELARAGLRLGVVTAQLALLVLVIGQYRIENPAFYQHVIPLTFAGFLLHHLLPRAYRLHFFLGLSLLGIWTVFGLGNGSWLIGIGLVLVGLCHLPIAFGARVALLLLAGATLAAMRAELLPAAWSGAIWPILGSMFMFRLIAYAYDLKHTKAPFDPARTLSYFFLLPNVAFPLFPVVDYATFRRTHYDQDAYGIYQRGVQWMLRGIVHLLLYRLVYQNLTIAPESVHTAADLARYAVTNFLLYLKVSGQFHLIVGMLHLFGFRLPETHHFFYLASSFTDFWRRINIYWKDFMQKVVYYPAYFRLRKRGETTALVLSTLAVFALTWLFHAYQWFWILGKFLLAWTDVLFWSILAVLLIANSLWENRHPRKRSLKAKGWSWRGSLPAAIRTAATFTVICLLWSLWTAPTIPAWLALWSVEGLDLPNIALAAAILAAAAAGFSLFFRGGEQSSGPAGSPLRFRSASLAAATMAGILLATSPLLTSSLGVGPQEFLRDLKVADLSPRDASLLQRGYYEELVGVNRFNSQLWEVYARRTERFPIIEETSAIRHTLDFLKLELRPLVGIPYNGGSFRTNRWGMRDQHYELAKPANTYRIALLGPSYSVGWGVNDHETFEWVAERRLNQDAEPGALRVEILNFSVPSYSVPQQLVVLEQRVLDFQPDAAFLTFHPDDGNFAARHLGEMALLGRTIPFPFLREIVRRAGVRAVEPRPGSKWPTESEISKHRDEALKRLAPFRNEILGQSYRWLVQACKARGVRPIWVYVSTPGFPIEPEEHATHIRLARESGFTVLDLSGAYTGHDPRVLRLADWDRHPNPRGHQLLADALVEALRARDGVLARPPDRLVETRPPLPRT
jgi:D-alanyl-lipoteichoic acid acyltransferase DltB (MBOAT superfamily)